MLAEAACELFLEQGYAATSVADITTRAGVSRSSFFNYFATKADVLWAGLDERIDGLVEELRAVPAGDDESAEQSVRRALAAIATGFRPDPLALALAQADAMGIAEELDRESGVRSARIARAVAERLRRDGADALRAAVRGAAYGGAVLVAIERWAGSGPGSTPLGEVLATALDAVASPVPDS